MKKIGCFHAHYSNIEHIERALSDFNVELIHFVDPGLDRRKHDERFTLEQAERKVEETLAWIADSNIDAVLVTCTFFTALLNEERHRCPVPIVKIDEPLFRDLASQNKPVLFVFTNPATVDGTMKQFASYAELNGARLRAEAAVLPGTFELIMQGRKEAYTDKVATGLMRLADEHPDMSIVAAQLSMVPAAQAAARWKSFAVGNALVSLAGYMQEKLGLEAKK
ncbi:hypothetical protein [Paenibacillus silvisoli]|uniref:hypothetical protein n=1 Tax=Paenibacillus silvisoli TaxID=3110539 RepID=UPI0028061769|nr:hypothetical protein [Paenibacillus silvisoli]